MAAELNAEEPNAEADVGVAVLPNAEEPNTEVGVDEEPNTDVGAGWAGVDVVPNALSAGLDPYADAPNADPEDGDVVDPNAGVELDPNADFAGVPPNAEAAGTPPKADVAGAAGAPKAGAPKADAPADF